VRLDDDHGLRISIRGHPGSYPVSTLKRLEGLGNDIRECSREH
jgi:hypothetical protein